MRSVCKFDIFRRSKTITKVGKVSCSWHNTVARVSLKNNKITLDPQSYPLPTEPLCSKDKFDIRGAKRQTTLAGSGHLE